MRAFAPGFFSGRALAMSSKCQWVPRVITEAIREAGLGDSQLPEPGRKVGDSDTVEAVVVVA
jgi:hypothetical protein